MRLGGAFGAFVVGLKDPIEPLIMNMVSQSTYYRTAELINRTFDLPADKIVSVNLKDVRWDLSHLFLKFDEVYPGVAS